MMKKLFFFLAVTGLLYGDGESYYQGDIAPVDVDNNYFEEVGKHFNIDPIILWAIAKKESNFDPYAINKNKNGTYDIGIMQINTIHLDKLNELGLDRKDLFNPRINIYFGGYVLANCFNRFGVTIKGLTCYNGLVAGNPYGYEVYRIIKKVERGV